MKKYVMIVHQKDGTSHNHHVCTKRFAKQLQNAWSKDNNFLCSAIYKKVEERTTK